MNFSGLITAITEETDRTNIASSKIAEKINTAMHNLERKNNFNYMKAKDSVAVTLAQGAYKIDFPTGYKKMIWFKYLDGSDYTNIRQESESYSLSLYPNLTLDTGSPETFATLHDESKFLIRPTADIAYSVYRAYYKYSTDLVVTSSETNWLTANAWEILFYGGLLELAPYLRDNEAIAFWQGKFTEVYNDQLRHEIAESDALSSSFIESAY
jgi:hypothetical protein